MAAEADVFCLVDHPHPPAAQFFQDAVMADGFADHPRSTSTPGMVGCWAHEVNETNVRKGFALFPSKERMRG